MKEFMNLIFALFCFACAILMFVCAMEAHSVLLAFMGIASSIAGIVFLCEDL